MSVILNLHDDYHQAKNAYHHPLLIKNLLDRAKIASRHKKIRYADRFEMSYETFFTRINRLANVLTDLGLRSGDVVAVMDWDTHRYLELYFAVPMCGLILQTVNVRLSEDKVLYTINHAKPKALFLNSEFAPMVKDHATDAPSIEKVVWLDDHDTPPPSAAYGEYEALLSAASDSYDFPDFDENTIATTFYTSGTTGNPKGVFFSHRQLVLHSLAVASTFGLNAEGQGLRYDDVYLPVTPLFHVHGWGLPYVATMVGLDQIYPGRYVPQNLVDLMEKYQVSFTHGVPTILQMLLGEMQSRGRTFNGMKMIIGGSRLTEGLCRQALDLGIEVFTAYGMSETCPVIACTTFNKSDQLSPEDDIKRRTKTGTPAVLTRIELWDEHGQAVATDGKSTGEIVVRSPWLTQSYFKNQDAGDELWAGGYLHTQDIANMNDKGELQVTDRLKDVIKSGGEWVSSLEIETLLSLHPSVADIAVIGIPDDKWGERPLALIVLKPTHQDTTADDIIAIGLQAVERGLIAKYAIPSDVKFVSELPKTSVGKLDKKVMRQMYAQGLYS